VSFNAKYGLSNDMWNKGNILRSCSAFSNSSVYIEDSLFAVRILYGPTNFGQSLLALPFGNFRFLVERYTRSPVAISGSSQRCKLAW
jgi:hypothetical protein